MAKSASSAPQGNLEASRTERASAIARRNRPAQAEAKGGGNSPAAKRAPQASQPKATPKSGSKTPKAAAKAVPPPSPNSAKAKKPGTAGVKPQAPAAASKQAAKPAASKPAASKPAASKPVAGKPAPRSAKVPAKKAPATPKPEPKPPAKPRNDLSAKLLHMISEEMAIEEAELTPNASFKEDLNLDQIDVTELLMQAESNFDIHPFNEDDWENCRTIDDFLTLVQKRVDARRGKKSSKAVPE